MGGGFCELSESVTAFECNLFSVFLNRLIIFLMWGVVYVKVVHFVSFFFFGVVGCERCWSVLFFSLCRMLIGKLLLSAVCLVVSHSFCS